MTSSSEYLTRTAAGESSIATERHFTALQAGEASQDKIASLTFSLAFLPLDRPISDAKVLTGRQKPMTQIAFLFAEITTLEGHQGVGTATPSAPAAAVNMPTPRRSPRR